MPQQEFAPDSYWQAVKDRMAGMVQAPIDAGKRFLGGISQAMPTDPNLRPGVAEQSPGALPADQDPNSPEFQRKAQIVRALLQQQLQGQGQAGQPQAPTSAPQGNPAGIQF